jgi:hypothetical protein
MSCGEVDLPSLVHLKELYVRSPPDLFPSKPSGTADTGMVEFCLISPHFPTSLTTLSIPMARFTRGSLQPLQRLTQLTSLDLSRGDWRADDWNWTPLADDPLLDDWIDAFPLSVTNLNIAHCHIFSDRLMRKLRRLPRLRALNVENCFQLTDAGIASLPKELEDLDMAQCIGVFRKGDTRQNVLPPHLIRLRLSFNFNDHFIQQIVICSGSLRALFLEKSHVTDAGMGVILSHCKHLEELSMSACINIGDETLAVLPSTVTSLDLWQNRNVTDAGLQALKPRIQILDVTNCVKITLLGLVDAVSHPWFRIVAVGSLFMPDHTLNRIALIRNSKGIYRNRPRLFSEVQMAVGSALAASTVTPSSQKVHIN